MKKHQTKPRSQKKRQTKKPLGELILVLSDGKKYDFFKLDHELRQSMLADPIIGPAIKKSIEEFKNK